MADQESPSVCGCAAPKDGAELPRDIIDLVTPFYHACGGRLYRLLLTTKPQAIEMGDGTTLDMRLNTMERALMTNTTTHFADTITQRNGLPSVIPGDRCYVTDASADPEVEYGGAMYIWLPEKRWRLLYMSDSPINCANLIRKNSGLKVDAAGKMYVDFSGLTASEKTAIVDDLIASGAGLGLDESGKLVVDAAALIASGAGLGTNSAGKIVVDGAALAGDGLAWSNGKFCVNLKDMNESIRGDIVDAIVRPGGGLAVGSDGRIYFDSANMDTSIITNLMKTLRLPIWLTGNTNYYVDKNHANAGDSLIEGRGLSPQLPFASIQAAVNYVADNFNVNKYTASIIAADGEYDESVRLGACSRTTGSLILKAANLLGAKIRRINGTSLLANAGSFWIADGLVLEAPCQPDEAGGLHYVQAVQALAGSFLTLAVCKIIVDASAVSGASDGFYPRGFNVTGSLTLGNSRDSARRLNNEIIYANVLDVFMVGTGGSVTGDNCETEAGSVVICEGGATTFMTISGGVYSQARSGGKISMTFAAKTAGACAGKRYNVYSGGKCDVGSSGPDYFPGTAEGTVDANSYSWYK